MLNNRCALLVVSVSTKVLCTLFLGLQGFYPARREDGIKARLMQKLAINWGKINER